jgi:hypothetical protein
LVIPLIIELNPHIISVKSDFLKCSTPTFDKTYWYVARKKLVRKVFLTHTA